MPGIVNAVVSRGGRPDLALLALPQVKSPVLLITGSLDDEVTELNQQALERLTCKKELVVIEGATHLFEEPGKLQEVAEIAGEWFRKHLSLIHI